MYVPGDPHIPFPVPIRSCSCPQLTAALVFLGSSRWVHWFIRNQLQQAESNGFMLGCVSEGHSAAGQV